jgi:uncharacterized surface protein with fasciclin (FAS1) repeats
MQTKKVLLILLAALLLMGATVSTGHHTVAAAPVYQTDGEEPDTTEMDEQQSEANSTLMDVIAANEQLSDLETLIEATGLADNLTKDGPFTVLAPTNAALATLDAVTADNNATITDILLYHIINGRYSHADLANMTTVPTLFGEQVAFSVESGEVMLNDSVRFITTDIEAENGVVHIVDALLIPPENSLSPPAKAPKVNRWRRYWLMTAVSRPSWPWPKPPGLKRTWLTWDKHILSLPLQMLLTKNCQKPCWPICGPIQRLLSRTCW